MWKKKQFEIREQKQTNKVTPSVQLSCPGQLKNASFDCLLRFFLCVDWLFLFIIGISSYLYCWIDEDVGESISRKGPTPLVCYLLSDCYLGVSTYLAPLHPLWIWPILHTKNFTTVVPLSQWCFVLTWLTLKKYTLLCLFHWPTVYLCLPKVSGDIIIRNCRTVEPSRWNKKLYQKYGLNMKSCIKTMA